MTSIDDSEILGPMYKNIKNDGKLALSELNLSEGAAILDVGTGAGKSAIFLAGEGYDVTTGEPETDTTHYANLAWAENAEKMGVRDRIKFQSFDASDMPFETANFEAVFFFGVLHHVDEPLREAVIAEALRVTEDKGAVVFFEPSKETLGKIWKNDPGHPLAANPADYLSDPNMAVSPIKGRMMDIFIYGK